jgi:serine/threonine protein phosphatase PrpC
MQRFFEERAELGERLSQNDDELVVERLNRVLIREVAPQILEAWRTKVLEHYRGHPPGENAAEVNVLLQYGKTLNVAAVTEGMYVALKVGDGNILLVYRDGTVHQPLAASSSHVGDETDSLCQSNALEAVRVQVSRLSGKASKELSMVFVCSDGFTNAFSSTEGFLKAASDFAALSETAQGRKTLTQSLEGWLQEYSEYSGDDVSVGILAAES